MLALDIKGISKTYYATDQKKPGKNVYALDDISLEVQEGDCFALLGPNGAGKSTLINIIASLLKQDKGTIKVLGHDLQEEREQAKLCLGIVPQEFNFNIFETVFQIISNQAGYYGVKYHIALEYAEHILKQLSLWDKKDTQSMKLSGGMKRRLMIARALIHKPKILILDEPTAGVDIELRRSMWAFIEQLKAGGTSIILTTHYLEEAEQLCNNIAIIDQGRIKIHTNMQDILQTLDKQTFIINISHPLSSIPQLKDYSLQKTDDTTLEVTLNKKQMLNNLFEQLNHHNIQISGVRSKVNRLEEIFMTLLQSKENT